MKSIKLPREWRWTHGREVWWIELGYIEKETV